MFEVKSACASCIGRMLGLDQVRRIQILHHSRTEGTKNDFSKPLHRHNAAHPLEGVEWPCELPSDSSYKGAMGARGEGGGSSKHQGTEASTVPKA